MIWLKEKHLDVELKSCFHSGLIWNLCLQLPQHITKALMAISLFCEKWIILLLLLLQQRTCNYHNIHLVKFMWWKVLCCMLRSRPKMKMKKRKIMCTDILAAVLSVGKHFSIFILLVYELGVGQCETSPVCFLRVIWKWILGHSMSFFFMKWTISLGEYGKSINLLNMWTKSHQVFLSVSKGRRRGNDDAFFFLCERE